MAEHRMIKSTDQLRIEYEKVSIALALSELDDQFADQLIEEINADEELLCEADALHEKSGHRTRKFIDMYFRKQRRSRVVKKYIPRVAQIAGYVLLTFFLGVTTVLATSPSFRIRAAEFLINIQDEYAILSLEETEISVAIPPEWKGLYYPTYIPDGYYVENILDLSGSYVVLFFNNDGTSISFTEHTASTATQIDTENAVYREEHIAGKSMFVVEKDGTTIITWSELDRYFVLTMDAPFAELLPVAEKIKKI